MSYEDNTTPDVNGSTEGTSQPLIYLAQYVNEHTSKPHKYGICDRAEIVAMLSKHRRTRCTKENCIGDQCPHKSGPAFTPTKLKKKKRGNDFVEALSLATFDVDKVSREQFERILASLEASGLDFCVYSTHTYKPEAPRVRVVFFITRPMSPREWAIVWEVVNVRFKFGADKKKDAARLFYFPTAPEGAETFTCTHPGKLLDIDEILERAPQRDEAPRADSVSTMEFPPASPEVLEEARQALHALGYAIQGNGGDAKTFVAAALLRNDFALTEEEAWPLLCEWNEECQPPWSENALRAKLRGGSAYANGAFGCKRQCIKPVIRIKAGEHARVATQTEEVLIKSGIQIYQRGGKLFRPIVEEVDAAKGRRTKVARLKEVVDTYLFDQMSKNAEYERFDKRSKAFVRTDPPREVANTLIARDGEWSFSAISGVITTPTLRPDGSILSVAGYDSETRLLLVDPPELPSMTFSKDAAESSLRRLESLLTEFPFVDSASKSVALSAILTSVGRGAFTVAPAHAVSASTAGTGKSFLWDVAAGVAVGQRCPVLTAPRDEAELEKRLGAAVMNGQPLISLDNMSISLGGDCLAQLIERPLVEVRILGRSELVRVENRACVFATGNNLTITGDITRRVLLARLDANMERPELRQFNGNPFTTVLQNRGQYVADALTVVASYAAAGRPKTLPKLASFEEWSDTVRSALVWLGREDPCATMEAARAEDPELLALRQFVNAWSEFVGKGFKHAVTANDLFEKGQAGDAAPGLKEAIENIATVRGRLDSKRLAYWLRKYKDRVCDGLRIYSKRNSDNKSLWWIDGGQK